MAGKLVSAVMWREEGDRWSCSLLHLENGCSRIVLEPGFNLSFSVLEGRFCVGYTELSSKVEDGNSLDSWMELRPCPTGAEIGRGIRCVDCLSSDIMRPCLRCDGTNCLAHPDLGRVCKGSTAYVYLATFGGRIKAGVSQGRRVLKRWIEQGADAAEKARSPCKDTLTQTEPSTRPSSSAAPAAPDNPVTRFISPVKVNGPPIQDLR